MTIRFSFLFQGTALVRTLAVMLTLVSISGCGGPENPDKFPDPGRVIVQVRDTSARPVAGILAELRTPNLELVWRSGTTAANGLVEIGQADGGVLPGDYALTVRLPFGYTLGPNQAASTPVSVRSREQANIVVTLTPL
jgi:hypothetical protein